LSEYVPGAGRGTGNALDVVSFVTRLITNTEKSGSPPSVPLSPLELPLLLPELLPLLLPELLPLLLPELLPLPLAESVPLSSPPVTALSSPAHAPTASTTAAATSPIAIVFALVMAALSPDSAC
jgi:hypothetical protein